MENTILQDFEKLYKETYTDNVVDQAIKYTNNCVLISLLPLKNENLEHNVKCDVFQAYLHGVQDAFHHKNDTIYKSKIETCKNSYVMSKDFCVAFMFGDNDFGSDILYAAQMYAENYNSILNSIGHYNDDEFNKIKDKSLYVKDLIELESLDCLKSIIKTGYISSELKCICERGFFNDYKTCTERLYTRAINTLNYLDIDNDEKWVVGSIDYVQDQILKKYASINQNVTDLNINNIWINGECLFMAVINGEMKVWVR